VGIPRLLAQGSAVFLLSGCAIAAGTCRYNDNAEAAFELSKAQLPAGCQVTGSQTALVQSFACVGGREGFVAANALPRER